MYLNLVVIKTGQLHELAEFYGLLGLEFEYHKHEQGIFHYSANLAGTVFEIYPLPKKAIEADTTTRLGFKVNNLISILADVRLKGNRVISASTTNSFGNTAIIEDLDGRRIELTELRNKEETSKCIPA